MPYTGPEPTRPQIERQLVRMLESDVFVRRPSQAALLKGIVEIALDEGEVREKRVREVVYPQHEPDSPVIRLQIRSLKDTTAEYYTGPGKDDLVLIYLESWTQTEKQRRQAGWNYKPTFEYAFRHELTRAYMGAWVKMHGGNLTLIPEAMATFYEIVEKDPLYVDAWLALGDAYCWSAILVLFDKPDDRREALDEATKCVEIAAKIAPESWHTHATRGFVSAAQGNSDDAWSEFKAALTANRLMTEGHPGYLLFHMATLGAESADFLESKAAELMGNSSAQAMHGRMLEWSGRMDEAEFYYKEALALDPNAALCHLGLGLFYQRQGRADEARIHIKRAEALMAPEDFKAWQAFGDYYNE